MIKKNIKNIKGLNFIFGGVRDWDYLSVYWELFTWLLSPQTQAQGAHLVPQTGFSLITFEIHGAGCTDCVGSGWGSSSWEAERARLPCSEQNGALWCQRPWQISEHNRMSSSYTWLPSLPLSDPEGLLLRHRVLIWVASQMSQFSWSKKVHHKVICLYLSLRNFWD